jgi:putative oxidoreductase
MIASGRDSPPVTCGNAGAFVIRFTAKFPTRTTSGFFDKQATKQRGTIMVSFMKAYENQTYALLRIVSGFVFLFHGTQKLLNFPARGGGDLPAHIQSIAGPIELVGGILIMIGLFTAPVAFLASGLMAAAYWMAHFSSEAYLPIMNRGDAAVLYCFVFLYLSTKGDGIWSVGGKA